MTHPTREGILDTVTLIQLGALDPASLPSEPSITSITLAELSVGPLVARTTEEQAARQAHLQQAESDFEPIPFDAPAARVFGRVAAELRGQGRKPAARAYDALIAAIAISRNLPLYTANVRDFEGISQLELHAVRHAPDSLAER